MIPAIYTALPSSQELICQELFNCSPKESINLTREYENFSQSRFGVGEWLPDGLVLGLRYDPQTEKWIYWLETPELEPSTRWWPESSLER